MVVIKSIVHAKPNQATRSLLPAPSAASTLCKWLATHLVNERLIRHKRR